jgi:small subunit ribosomal protein S10
LFIVLDIEDSALNFPEPTDAELREAESLLAAAAESEPLDPVPEELVDALVADIVAMVPRPLGSRFNGSVGLKGCVGSVLDAEEAMPTGSAQQPPSDTASSEESSEPIWIGAGVSIPATCGRIRIRIRIRMEAYDHLALDASAKEIVEHAKGTNAKVAGPIPLPTRVDRYTVLRSPFIDKKSREQFEIHTHKRIIDIMEPNARTVEALNRLVAHADVFVKIKA